MTKLFTIPPDRPFLDTLAEAILTGEIGRHDGGRPDDFELPSYRIMLPTRRAARGLADAFLRVSGRKALLLPRIVPISSGDEDAGLLTALAGSGDAGDLDIPPAIDDLDRRLALSRLVLHWSAIARERSAAADQPMTGARSTAEAMALAADLASLIDLVETEGASLDGLDAIVPDELARHWQDTLDFLSIVTKYWPAYLQEVGLLSPATRRNAVLRAEARRLRSDVEKSPVIIAGVTGSIPATTEVMQAVLERPNGAIVLPALDVHLDEESWTAILSADGAAGHPEHPQHGLAKLLAQLRAKRSDVRILGNAARRTPRIALVSEALRPAATTDRWRNYLGETPPDLIRAAAQGLDLVEAAHPAEEAEVIVLALRRQLETPGTTAALVSPDRRLARRVAIRLAEFGIAIDDSAGKPFAKTPVGTFLELVVDAVSREFEPSAVVALLGHPLTRLGRSAREVRFAARALEIAALRGLYVGRGLDGLRHALDHAQANKLRRGAAVKRLWIEDWQRAEALVRDLTLALQPLVAIFASRDAVSLRALAEAHASAGEALSARPEEERDASEGEVIWQGEAGETAALLFARLADESLEVPDIKPGDYPDVFRALFGTVNVRQRGPVHPRLSILGPFEARLQQPDLVILGSLNDGTWPEAADPGPWLSRPMRQALGLPSPEERIGAAAHDVWSLLGAPHVLMTRAIKVDGTPTVASRWLLRLEALLKGAGVPDALAPREPWLSWVRGRHMPVPRKPYLQPAPCPARELRPRRLSVSDVETWIANPYALYAKRILRLEELDAIGVPADGALRGSVLHDALNRFAKDFPCELPEDVSGRLMARIEETLRDYAGDARIAAFWLPRFERFAAWFAETEAARRSGIVRVLSEADGSLVLEAPGGPFQLTARADRIDVAERHAIITDYKTGTPPDRRKVVEMRAPQLALEAAILLKGGFANLDRTTVELLRYIKAGGGDPPGEETVVVAGGAEVSALAEDSLRKLADMVAEFDDPLTPYRALRRAGFFYDYDAYEHLARVDEWSENGGGT